MEHYWRYIQLNIDYSQNSNYYMTPYMYVCPLYIIIALTFPLPLPSLQSLTEAEYSQVLGITNTMHKLKLRLAVQEIVSITSTRNLAKTVRMPQFPQIRCDRFFYICQTPFYGDMTHTWISDYWLPSLGLPQYSVSVPILPDHSFLSLSLHPVCFSLTFRTYFVSASLMLEC